MKRKTKRIATLGLCTALALVFAYVEALLPPLFSAIPGIKLGLPNIVVIFVLCRYGAGSAFAVSLVRVAAVSLLFGNPVTFAYSVSGAVLSLLVMILLRRVNLFSAVGVSVAGGVFHNVGQILMAILLLGTAELGYYLAVLALSGTVSGIFVGVCGALAHKKLPKFS